MIIEERCYTLAPGNIDTYWALYTPEIIAVMEPMRPHMLGYYISNTGMLNQIVHLWRFENYAKREQKRAALAANPAWQAHLGRIRKLCRKQETRILRPSPVAGLSPLADATRTGATRN